MKTVTVPLICYSCRGQFGMASFTAGGEDGPNGPITKISELTHEDRDWPYNIKFFCCKDCANRPERDGTVYV